MNKSIKGGFASLICFAWVIASSIAITILIWRLSLDHFDQSLFRLGAKVLAEGGWLYQDFWDLKQPGIYWFYQFAGWLFDPASNRGYLVREVLLLNSVWLVVTTALCALIVRDAFPVTRVWLLVPVVALLTFVLRLDTYSIAQVESLVMLPLLWIIYCMHGAVGTRSRGHRIIWFALAGAGVAWVALAKLVLVPVAITLVLVGAWYMPYIAMSNSSHRRAPLLVVLLSAAIGMCAVWCGFALAGLSSEFLWTQFVFPQKALGSIESEPPSKFFVSTMHLGSYGIFFLPLAILGIRQILRQGDVKQRVFLWSCLMWIGAGFLVIAPQSFSWHSYHFIVLLWPLAMLACAGLATSSSSSGNLFRSFAIAVLIVGSLINAGRWLIRPVVPDATIQAMQNYRAEMPDLLSQIQSSPCRTALIFGSPALFHATDLTPTTKISGQLAPILLPMQWEDLLVDSQRTPPQFVYLDNAGLTRTLKQKSPILAQWIASNYQHLHNDMLGGSWFGVAEHDAKKLSCSTAPGTRT